ncbi:aldehyde dehydrogenase family protein [Pirellulales bacterium]|nr:aldehyde dehydrogenase family protein [Pirellulales bacterium]
MSFSVVNPFDGSKVAEIRCDSGNEIEAKLDAARDAQIAWRELNLDQRAGVVRAGLAAVESASEQIVRDVTRQMGKPLAESRGELRTFFARAEQALNVAASALAPEVISDEPDIVRRIEHAPLGVVLNLAAWNYPLLIPVNVIVPALLAGNVVLLKHSTRTLLTGRALADAFGQLEISGLVTELVLGHQEVAKVMTDARIDFAAFTGSVAGGRAVHRAAAERLLDVGLELGGNDSAYVAADADLDFAVPNIVEGACYNAGQSCCAIERVYVHRDRYDEFLERALPLVADLRLGDPLDESTTMGPMASSAAPAELQAQVDQAVRRGARLLAGGRQPNDIGANFFEPTVLADVPQDADVMQEESFGPLLPVAAVSDDGEAIDKMNDSRYGLTASIWTTDAERADLIASRVDAGTVFQNRADYIDPDLPWTGWKESGFGSTLSRYGYHQMTRRKAIHLRRNP